MIKHFFIISKGMIMLRNHLFSILSCVIHQSPEAFVSIYGYLREFLDKTLPKKTPNFHVKHNDKQSNTLFI